MKMHVNSVRSVERTIGMAHRSKQLFWICISKTAFVGARCRGTQSGEKDNVIRMLSEDALQTLPVRCHHGGRLWQASSNVTTIACRMAQDWSRGWRSGVVIFRVVRLLLAGVNF